MLVVMARCLMMLLETVVRMIVVRWLGFVEVVLLLMVVGVWVDLQRCALDVVLFVLPLIRRCFRWYLLLLSRSFVVLVILLYFRGLFPNLKTQHRRISKVVVSFLKWLLAYLVKLFYL